MFIIKLCSFRDVRANLVPIIDLVVVFRSFKVANHELKMRMSGGKKIIIRSS